MDAQNNNNQLEIFERLSAFHLFKVHGLETACSIYPHHKEFILAHMSLTLDEVRQKSYKDLDKKDSF